MGAHSIGLKKYEWIQTLLARGRDTRTIAKVTSVSESTVKSIEGGSYKVRELTPRDVDFQRVPVYCCPTCEKRVILSPCPKCLLEKSA